MARRCPKCKTEYPDRIAFCGEDGSVNIEIQSPDEEPDPRLGEKLGDYIVVAHIADGAMGAVYEARNAETRERVAIKVLHPDVEEDDVAVERFRREYETADMLDHPNIVKVIDFGQAKGGNHYMTMEYLEGVELGHVLRSEEGIDAARALRALAQVAQALEDAHAFGVIHRDLKPDNVFLCRADGGDHVRILDFGSVKLQVETGPKLTAMGTTLGSPFYMSPEQAKGLPDVDTRTDVFAMGAILYECLTGTVAFAGDTIAEILMKIVRKDPSPPTALNASLPEEIDAVIAKAIAKDKDARFSTTSEFVNAALAAFGVEGSLDTWVERPEPQLRAAIGGGEARRPMGASEMGGAPSSAEASAASAPVSGGTSDWTPAVTPAPVEPLERETVAGAADDATETASGADSEVAISPTGGASAPHSESLAGTASPFGGPSLPPEIPGLASSNNNLKLLVGALIVVAVIGAVALGLNLL